MNIYIQEFKMHLKSVITWSVSLIVILFFIMSMFSSIAEDAELLNETLSNFPKELLMAFGMENLDLTSVLGFYGLAFVFCQLCLAIQASNYGFGILSMEERDLTADFLMAKPISRTKILNRKLISALTGMVITNAVVWASTFITLEMYRDGRPYDVDVLILLLASVFIFQLFFLSVGMLVSLLVKKVRSVTPFSMALAFGMYIINAFSGMLGESKFELLTPFKHFDPNTILKTGELEMPLVMITVSVVVISFIGSYVLYNKRNIPSAS